MNTSRHNAWQLKLTAEDAMVASLWAASCNGDTASAFDPMPLGVQERGLSTEVRITCRCCLATAAMLPGASTVRQPQSIFVGCAAPTAVQYIKRKQAPVARLRPSLRTIASYRLDCGRGSGLGPPLLLR